MIQIADPANLGGGHLDPRLKRLLALSPAPESRDVTPQKERAVHRTRIAFLARVIAREPLPHIEDLCLTVKGPVPGEVEAAAEEREVPVRLYAPEGEPPFPVLVFLHGGGWVLGDLDQSDAVCRRLAKLSGWMVVSVDYRLAPEHKFPAALDDTCAVLEWLAGRANEIGGDPARLAVSGGSAGANLATAACLIARKRGHPAIAFQLLFNPVTDLSRMDTASHRRFGNQGYGITTLTLQRRREQYINHEEEYLDPRVSPLLAGDLRCLPPALIITAEFDPLRDEGEAYAERLAQVDVPTHCIRYNGVAHGFFNWPGILSQANSALDEAASFVRSFSPHLPAEGGPGVRKDIHP